MAILTPRLAALKEHPGKSFPLGATVTPEGVNFAIYSKRADYLELLLFESEDSPLPSVSYTLSPIKNRTSNYWHIFIEGLKANQVYAFRAHGKYEPWCGLRFDPEKVLLDPYSRGVVGWQNYVRANASKPGDNCATSLRSVVLDWQEYDWENDRKPDVPYSKTVIYELHVGGFTRNANSHIDASKRGTFAGLIEKLPYLKDLGVTTLELMPVQAFDKQDAPPGLSNYWGYSPVAFFAPHLEFSSQKTAIGALNEFRDMVKACHANGMEVILDVVFNHTSENDERGPTLSFRGLDDLTYYTLDQTDYHYKNFSGCGNTLRSDHPIVGKLILESLRFWAQDMHVDGFRFDLASILSRDIFGKPLERPPLIWAIESDPVLASAKLIAEAWDPAGLYQVGWFVPKSNRFAEWNGPFRDDVRKFVKGDDNTAVSLALRLTGSSDIYGTENGDAYRAIHFLTCHDGFTLNDLVTYNQKHIEANGENNRDGHNENYCWNCGHEGPTDDREIERLRVKQIKNMLTILFLSRGTPMICAGDEVRRTTFGNNNPYCQDNESNWFDWDLVGRHREILDFTRRLIELSKMLSRYRHGNLADSASSNLLPAQRISATWHGVKRGQPDLARDSHTIAMEIRDGIGNQFYAAFNAFWQPLDFELPEIMRGPKNWRKLIDTSKDQPEDIFELSASPAVAQAVIRLEARSSVCLVSEGLVASLESLDQLEQPMPRRRGGITWTSIKKPIIPS